MENTAAPTTVIKPQLDKREYRVITLSNQLQAILIHDKETDKASAAMSVNVGYFCDPDAVPGLAHFLEHMLFLGSEKYPKENSYSSYLAEHAGQANAFTDQEDTNYYFDVGHQFLEGALDRFAQFFIAPLFTHTAIEREMLAVDSENTTNLQQDMWRLNQLARYTANPSHPYHKFGTGNLKTLRDGPQENNIDIRTELLMFYSTFYSANQMKLAVLGRESLDILQEWVEEKFSGIKNTDRAETKWDCEPFGEQHLQLKLHVIPVQEARSLTLYWPVPALEPNYRRKPEEYVCHLLGHEGPGSVLSLLKKYGWATSLFAGPTNGGSNFGIFRVAIDITDEGLAHVEDIVKIIFQYISLLRSTGVQKWIFDELQVLSRLQFHFKNNGEPFHSTMAVTRGLKLYSEDWVLAGPYLLDQYDPELIEDFINRLTPEKLRYEVLSKEFEGKTTLTEPWYQTQYNIERIPATTLQEWNECGQHPDLALPLPNEFIPTDFSLRSEGLHSTTICEGKTWPELLEDNQQFKIWYKLDTTFKTPKRVIRILFITPVAYQSPKSHVMTELFVLLVSDSLNEYAYAAELTGLDYNLESAIVGMELAVSGYNHKQSNLLERILHRIANLNINSARFDALKEKAARTFKNIELAQACSRAMYHTSLALLANRWNNNEYVKVIESVTAKDLEAFIPHLISSLCYECLFHGNISKEEAFGIRDLLKSCVGATPLQAGEAPMQRVVALPERTTYWLTRPNQNLLDMNTAVEIYYQIGRDNPRYQTLLEVICQLIKDPLYNVLRTQEQLGYIVHGGMRMDYGVLGLVLILQSEKDPQLLDERAEAFLSTFPTILESLSAEEFQNHINALILVKQEAHKSLEQESWQHWEEIINHSYQFGRKVKQVEILNQVAKESVLEFFNTYLAQEAPKRRKIASHIFTEATAPKTGAQNIYHTHQRLDDFHKFKGSMYLFPWPAYTDDIAQ